jgi:hypothetical protein
LPRTKGHAARFPVARQGTRIVDSDIVIILTLASALHLIADHSLSADPSRSVRLRFEQLPRSGQLTGVRVEHKHTYPVGMVDAPTSPPPGGHDDRSFPTIHARVFSTEYLHASHDGAELGRQMADAEAEFQGM